MGKPETEEPIVAPEISREEYSKAKKIVNSFETQVIQDLERVASKIRHCGDAGTTFFNPELGKVIWQGADADGSKEQGHTEFDDIRNNFLAVHGVESVQIVGENDDTPEPWIDDAWVELSTTGIDVNAIGPNYDEGEE